MQQSAYCLHFCAYANGKPIANEVAMSPLISLGCAGLLLSTVPGVTTVDLQPHTAAAFERYIHESEARLYRQAHGDAFLWVDAAGGRRDRVRRGEVAAEPFSGNGDAGVPDGT